VSGNPWADPSTPTEPGLPYAGPPMTVPPTAPPPGYGYPYGPPAYGPPSGYPPPWGPYPPAGARRPGQVITSAVLAFVQAALVLLSSVYVWFFASIADMAAQEDPAFSSETARALYTEGTVLTAVQLASAVLLVVAGILALHRRSRGAWLLLVAGHVIQVVLAGYWAVRLIMLFADVPGPEPSGTFASFTLFFAAAPLVGIGLVVVGPGRRWFGGTAPAQAGGAAH
jgi:hypothetical protein